MADDDGEIEMPDDYVGRDAPVSAGDVTSFEWPPRHWGFATPKRDDSSELAKIDAAIDDGITNAPDVPALAAPPSVSLPWAVTPSEAPGADGPPGAGEPAPAQAAPPASPPAPTTDEQIRSELASSPTAGGTGSPADPYEVRPSGLTRDVEDQVLAPQRAGEAVRQQALAAGASPEVANKLGERAAAGAMVHQAGIQAERGKQADLIALRDQQRAITEDTRQQIVQRQTYLQNFAKIQQDSAAMNADAQRIANTKINPNRVQFGGAEFLGGMLSAIGSGIAGGQNGAMAEYHRRVEQDIDAQKSDIANAWKGVEFRKGAIAEEYARHGDLDRATTAYRQAQFQNTINAISTERQLFDPAGQMGQAYNAQVQQLLLAQQKNQADFEKRQMDKYKLKAEMTDKLAEARKKGMSNPEAESYFGAKPIAQPGIGGATNTKFTIPIGINNPFSSTPSPMMGTRKLTTEELKEVTSDTKKYNAEQQIAARLSALGAKLKWNRDPASGISERLADADEREYEGLRAQLIDMKAKDLTGKVNETNKEDAEKAVPALKQLISADDPAKRMQDWVEQNDEEYRGKLTIYGVDADPQIRGARSYRAAAPIPEPGDQLAAAHEKRARATSPSDIKDADAEIAAAADRVTAVAASKNEDRAIVHLVDSGNFSPFDMDFFEKKWQRMRVKLPDSADALKPTLAGKIDAYNTELAKYKQLRDPHLRPGEDAADAQLRMRGMPQQIVEQARRVEHASRAMESAERSILDKAEKKPEDRGVFGVPTK